MPFVRGGTPFRSLVPVSPTAMTATDRPMKQLAGEQFPQWSPANLRRQARAAAPEAISNGVIRQAQPLRDRAVESLSNAHAPPGLSHHSTRFGRSSHFPKTIPWFSRSAIRSILVSTASTMAAVSPSGAFEYFRFPRHMAQSESAFWTPARRHRIEEQLKHALPGVSLRAATLLRSCSSHQHQVDRQWFGSLAFPPVAHSNS